MLLTNHLSTTSISAAKWTNKDPVLSKVRRYTLGGWLESQLGEDFKPYKCRSQELRVDHGCVIWGSRVVIPPQGRDLVLKELHDTHPDASKMKALAHCYVWWPNMDSAIESLVKQCTIPVRSRGQHQQQCPCILRSGLAGFGVVYI